jgi:hypothetical protein
MNEAIIERLQEIASTRIWSDDSYKYAPVSIHSKLNKANVPSSDIEDVYEEGFEVGQVRLARKLLLDMGLSYTIKEEV